MSGWLWSAVAAVLLSVHWAGLLLLAVGCAYVLWGAISACGLCCAAVVCAVGNQWAWAVLRAVSRLRLGMLRALDCEPWAVNGWMQATHTQALV